MDISKNNAERDVGGNEEDDDEDDEDYVPDEDVDDKDDGIDSEGEPDDFCLSGDDNKLKNKDDSSNQKPQLSAIEVKKRSDELWSMLKEDSNSNNSSSNNLTTTKTTTATAITTTAVEKTTSTSTTNNSKLGSSLNPSTLASGTSTGCSKSVPKLKLVSALQSNKRNLSDLVSNLKKKPKVGTLLQSKMDWDDFKKEEGLEDELRQAVNRKDGYIERQAFLSRADLRQFEIEKSIRDKIRKPPQ
ncbi:yeti [Brevipalpus obovatus]|uniref:yeti n=1 Tax=Brevipalpus obovatus TaxID=246614 RepID=UPI003D9EE389